MALETLGQPIATPEDELRYLREQVAKKEQELAQMRENRPREEIASEQIHAHRAAPAHQILAPEMHIAPAHLSELAANLDPESDDETMLELKQLMETKGIKNAFAVLEKLGNPHLEDDFHRFLVQYLLSGMPIAGFEKQPAWKALHMTLYEIALPQASGESPDRAKPLREMISAMEQFYAGMSSVGEAGAAEPPYFSLELANPIGRAHLMFYASVPNSRRDLFEKQIAAIFPGAEMTPQPNDYNVFVQDGASLGSFATLARPAALPLKDYADFDYDPLNSLLNAFAKIAPENEGASLQIMVAPRGNRFSHHYRRVLEELKKGEYREKALSLPEGLIGEAARDLGKLFFGGPQEKIERERSHRRETQENKTDIEQVEKKLTAPIVGVNLRLTVSSADPSRAEQILHDLESAFHQFENASGNRLEWKRVTPGSRRQLFRDIAFRIFEESTELPLSLRELTTLYHFPPSGIESTPHLKQSRFTTSAAPVDLPREGICLGTNAFRGQSTEVRLTSEDRLRHLYVIGQTGTGKSGFLQTLIKQDIENGDGVCFIDPHGKDVLEILAMVPPERYEDVIYFDPAYIDRPFGLNMLEYDPAHPEQKSFIVNEMLAIFRQLYGDVPESMGPAFEQYFRNATQLVMEDPASGSTLMDIGRVLSNAPFRNLKLSRSRNPIVNQFWQEIATKAEGEASLQNIVPYITNKFDEFTANDFMRPIIGQQASSFRFREVIDQKKILLVNLSKGRLGERNANLLGLILVGKLFMAAMSRADTPSGQFPPFYLYIDEFQNITTDSIPSILSEARKYKLSLTIAHQFLGQVNEKIRDAVFGNVGSLASFRVGQEDGEFFEKQFAPVFKATDFVNIENRNAYVRILSRGVPQRPFNIRTLDLAGGNQAQVDDLRQLSYLTYGRDRATIEEAISRRYLS